MEVQHRYYSVNGIQLHVAEAGDPEGEVLLFLHGFPEFWYGWHRQLAYFAAKGFRVLAPDQRGYNLSGKPAGIRAYALPQLAADVADLIQQVIRDKVYLVGHDWGGAVAWAVAQHYPHLLRQLIILNMPHPAVMQHHLRHDNRQRLKSWYAAFFQLPLLPEFINSAFGFRMLSNSLRSSSNPGTFQEEELAQYKRAWRQPQALTCMLHWYRAYPFNTFDKKKEVTVPTLLLWGRKDKFLSEEMAQPSIDWCPNGQLVFLDKATHWLHHEFPDEVNGYIEAFVRDEL